MGGLRVLCTWITPFYRWVLDERALGRLILKVNGLEPI
jgi:hypothetical protein